jgi:hypothetical protein
MSITLLSSWEGVATSFQLGLQNGGPVALVWGMILSASGTLCLALSLAEMASICPISGAQYHVRSPRRLLVVTMGQCGILVVANAPETEDHTQITDNPERLLYI